MGDNLIRQIIKQKLEIEENFQTQICWAQFVVL
jgi:hypothetical protein